MFWKHLPFILFAASAVSAAAGTSIGCGPSNSDRYYCDVTGCFQCDGYGCSSVAPPTPTQCTGSSSCTSGTTCTAAGCVQNCAVDTDCAKGTVCQGGLCLAPQQQPPATKECTTNTDCGTGKACAAGKCETCGGTAGPCPCAASTDCASTETCVSGACTAKTNTCQFSSQCGSGKVCADGQCLAECDAQTMCTGNTTCVKGVCEPNTVGTGGDAGADAGPSGCLNDSQCLDTAAPNCVSGQCVASCTADPQCGNGKFCDQGACVVDTRPTPNCTTNAQCTGSNQTCMAGYCKYGCTTDKTCELIDSRIGYCGQDKVCRTQAEAHPQCTQKSDCSGTQNCIGNICK